MSESKVCRWGTVILNSLAAGSRCRRRGSSVRSAGGPGVKAFSRISLDISSRYRRETFCKIACDSLCLFLEDINYKCCKNTYRRGFPARTDLSQQNGKSAHGL